MSTYLLYSYFDPPRITGEYDLLYSGRCSTVAQVLLAPEAEPFGTWRDLCVEAALRRVRTFLRLQKMRSHADRRLPPQSQPRRNLHNLPDHTTQARNTHPESSWGVLDDSGLMMTRNTSAAQAWRYRDDTGLMNERQYSPIFSGSGNSEASVSHMW